jgi:hypothetical protein
MQYSGQNLLWLIGSLSRIFRIPFNSNQILSLEEGDCVMQKLNAKLTLASLMSALHVLMQRMMKLGLILLLGASISACSTSWKEEVQLHDGSKIIVKRSVERGGRHELGQQPPIKEQDFNFTLPTTNELIVWKSAFSEDVGLADFMPMLVDIVQGSAYVVTAPVGCLSYNKWGRPNPPYVAFKYEGKEWKRIPLQELPAVITTPNLIFSSPDNKVEEMGKSFITAEEIQRIISNYSQPEYRRILREALPKARINEMCMEMVSYKGSWVMPNDPIARKFIDAQQK